MKSITSKPFYLSIGIVVIASVSFLLLNGFFSHAPTSKAQVPSSKTSDIISADWEVRRDVPGWVTCPDQGGASGSCRLITITHLDVNHSSEVRQGAVMITPGQTLQVGETVTLNVFGWGAYVSIGAELDTPYTPIADSLPEQTLEAWQDYWGDNSSPHYQEVPDPPRGGVISFWLTTAAKRPDAITLIPEGFSCAETLVTPSIVPGSSVGMPAIPEAWLGEFSCTVTEEGIISLSTATTDIFARQWPAVVPTLWNTHGCELGDPRYEGSISLVGHRDLPGEDGHFASASAVSNCLLDINENVMLPVGNQYSERRSEWQIPGADMVWYFEGEAAGGPLPDLIVQSSEMIPSAPAPGQDVSVNATIKNQGGANADASITRLRIDRDNDGSWDVASNRSAGALAPNGIEIEEWNTIWTALAGTHTYEVCVDSEGTVTESDEENNCVTQIFTVSPPGPFTYSLSASGDILVLRTGSGSNAVSASLTSGSGVTTFGATGFPSGATPSFSPSGCPPPCSSIHTVDTSSAPSGDFTITVTGTPPPTANATYTLQIRENLIVVLNADPVVGDMSGSPPTLGVILTADVTDTEPGTFDYTYIFDCDGSSGQGGPGGSNLAPVSFSANHPSTSPDESFSCTYSSPGTHTARVIVDRDDALVPTSASRTVFVKPPLPVFRETTP